LTQRDRVRLLLSAWAWVYAGSIAVFFVTDRYRVPLLPVLVVLAACTVETIASFTAADRRRWLPLWLLGTSACFAVTSPELLGVDVRRMRRDLHVHAALREADAGRFDAALGEFAAARALDPSDRKSETARRAC